MQEPSFYRRLGFLSVVAILLLAVSAIGVRYWLLSSDRQSTDSAFIEARAPDAAPSPWSRTSGARSFRASVPDRPR
jgi:hypothetical protein